MIGICGAIRTCSANLMREVASMRDCVCAHPGQISQGEVEMAVGRSAAPQVLTTEYSSAVLCAWAVVDETVCQSSLE